MAIEISKTYEPTETEEKLYNWWESQGFFEGDPDAGGEPFTMVLPPPNVTGSLHMGHALNITLQDILARWNRMRGLNVLWVPGTDHAGIATQNVVERRLADEGKKRTDFSREEFEQIVWDWKAIAEANILKQIRRLGCSCDWSRKRFTLDEGLSRAVREVFVQLYEQGLVYRGEYLVNWCPRCVTAISDLEVEYEPANGHLWHIRYPVAGSDRFVTVATTRPETMLGDTAVAVHPNDERYSDLKGKTILLPLMNREIPVIFDDFVETEFGTGVVKVTPGHDPADFEAGRRHDLPIIKVIGDDGAMTEEAGVYAGLDRDEARQRVVQDLEKLGLLEKVEKHNHNVGQCQRCQTVVEPLVSRQWFVKVKPLADQANRAVEEKRTVFVPQNYEKIYFEWMRNIHDWCISRQLWWGHRVPAWTCGGCGHLTVSLEDPKECSSCGSTLLVQETDVLDTWFSSGLWPFSTLGWPEKTRELELYYPTSTMVTGFDIIFFWVARMMMMGLRFMDQVPFEKVFINGLVRDEDGQKMSKSRGNIIDPLGIIDDYGTDAVRFTLSVMAVPGADIPFSVNRMAGYRAFCNKIWNAARFLLMNLDETKPVGAEEVEELLESGQLKLEERWILSRLHQTIASVEKDLDRFFVHEASNTLYHFFWHEVCDWYIELIKAAFTGEDSPDRRRAQRVAVYVLDTSFRLLHPFIPFITEELWQKLPHEGETIMRAAFPVVREAWIDEKADRDLARLQGLITAMRTARAENNIDPRHALDVVFRCSSEGRQFVESQLHHVQNLVKTRAVDFVTEWPSGKILLQGVAGDTEFGLLLDDVIDVDAEMSRLEKEKKRTLGEIENLQRKLSNESFLSKAPDAVVEKTRNRHREVLQKLEKIEDQLKVLVSAKG
ncbi:MAG: valine--tRNA ligase [Acidobacteriota bacterium]|nr:MAG: valine--tRNA ligase [Acidobacteriota bacterium]